MDNQDFSLSKENELKATKKELEFILSQANILLQETISSADSVVNRSTILLTLLLGLLSSLISVIFTNADKITHPLQCSIIIVSTYVLYILIRLYFNLRGDTYKVRGEHPKYLLNDWYFDNFKDDSEREKQLLIIIIDSYQDRITHNKRINKPRWSIFGFCLALSLFIPVLFLIIYGIITVVCP